MKKKKSELLEIDGATMLLRSANQHTVGVTTSGGVSAGSCRQALAMARFEDTSLVSGKVRGGLE